tara:strand:- start:34473 stop:35018 length:546 start_codon:yes stop_codon:yes gene_type:complete
MYRTSFLSASLAASLAASACSTGYVPKRNGKLAVVMQGGQVGYERDGRFHSHGVFGGGLVDAVRGVPAAESAAEAHQSRTAWGFVSTIGGMVCSSVAFGYAIEESENRSSSSNAGLLALGCLGASALGLGLIISAVPYRFDAVNIFNDSVQPTGPVYMPGQAPPLVGPPVQRPMQRPPGSY